MFEIFLPYFRISNKMCDIVCDKKEKNIFQRTFDKYVNLSFIKKGEKLLETFNNNIPFLINLIKN